MAHKRPLDDFSSAQTTRIAKKSKFITEGKLDPKNASQVTNLVAEEVDFPRGGGTSFTPLEVKAIRAEAVKEANELFEDVQPAKPAKKRKRKQQSQASGAGQGLDKSNNIRIEHLNYKRMHVGMKILGQIMSVQPLGLVVSLPNQLFGHVPITNISSQLTTLLENEDKSDEDPVSEDEDEEKSASHAPDLFQIFEEGQFIRCVVSAVHAPGSTDTSGFGTSRDVVIRNSRRVELTLAPAQVNAGVQKSDLRQGFTITAAVQSIEDHGYILDFGVAGVSGFLSFKDTKLGSPVIQKKKIYIGQLVDAVVTNMSSNGRTCNVIVDPSVFSSSSLSEVTNASSVLPGMLVQTLITAVHPTGLNLQVLGFFGGTVDQIHLFQGVPEKRYAVGEKIKGRVLYDFASTPPNFAIALTEHILALDPQRIPGSGELISTIGAKGAYPIGTIIEAVKVQRLEPERGLIVEVKPGLDGFVHISHTSDEHVPTLSASGSWKPGSIHRARVTGYFSLDGLLQLSLKPSVLEQKYLQVGDVEVGQIIRGTIKKLTEAGLFITLSGSVDGVVWPNHYADIILKQPSKRFKAGAGIKCRVLVVDTDRKRISLTAKKTLLDSTLPILSSFDDAKVGQVTHSVVFKIYEKHLMVEFYNNLKALVPMKEISEIPLNKPSDSFPIGRVVKVRIIAIEKDQKRLVASIRQATSSFKPAVMDISGVEIGNIVEGSVAEIHKDNAVLTLQPTQIRALLSLKNLANHRSLSLAQLRVTLKAGDILDQLIVVTRNTEQGFVIVANKPKGKETLLSKGPLSMGSITVGQIVGGRVTRHTRQGALVKIATHIGGILHSTDISDDFDTGGSFPPIDSILKAVVIGVDQSKKQLTLSTRGSKMYPGRVTSVVDREIDDLNDFQAGETVRGFVKSVADHGLFVTVGRNIDARVQIRELFDDFIKDWKPRFVTNQLVKGRILSVDLETKKVEMSLRKNPSRIESSSALSFADIQIGQKVAGTVKKVENYGLFIQIDGSKLSGLCHKSQLSDNEDADTAVALHGFREGDRVKAIILGIEKRKISLSLKPSHFGKEDFEVDDDSEEPELELGLGLSADVVGASQADSDIEDEDVMQIDEAAHHYQPPHTPQGPISSQTAPTPSLQLSGGFQWTSYEPEPTEGVDSASSSEESDPESQPSKKKKRKRKEIEHDLTADMQTKTPESNADFERILLGSPNSSYLWVQYMSFHLQLSEIEKARDIARRAIRTINFREEQERLNVWIALLNMECIYGTEETLGSVFKEAAQANDSKTIHLRLASILDQAEKLQEAEEQYKRTCKKFGQSSKVWILFGEYYLRKGDIENARKLLPRSLQSLDKRKHLKTISRFAQLEYKHGEPERGKTVFEGIIDSHPKRWDLWSVYMDMEAGQGNIQSLRNLFDRVLAIKMTSHKAKSFFKKWLELERRLGDEDGANVVKQKAIEWTQKANAS
ncbi:hypothetical protein BDZ94DRAFT_1266781 [Collybia nuda]|uniref:S1 motif domain-containing protein n=1 Tax=Collybia nuda TaxID=64659 RepID=A0A9P5Y2J9_9AGAR|nr:hypothetical protein BDZ94DRAFT_1266781 [Collybia nuda]